MKAYKLEKDIKLFKVQFDNFCLNLFQEYRLDRLSLDVDGLLFRIKYMIKNNKDLYKIPELQNQFTDKARQLHSSFGEFLYMLIAQVITIPDPFKLDDLEDVLAQDVKIDTTYVKFKMIIISKNKEFLKYIDNEIPEDKVYNIDPNEYFRFYTDSYNDGVAKAYPELFENRQQDVVGTGADSDVFVHNVTLQTSERCSLNCFSGDSLVLMANGSQKPIKDIKLGDLVLACSENIIKDNNNETFYNGKNFVPTKVTHLFRREAETVGVWWKDYHDGFRVTRDHPFLTPSREWLSIDEIMKSNNPSHGFIFCNEDKYVTSVNSFELKYNENDIKVETVYNLETELHTFIVCNLVCHNCTYCYQFNKTPMRMSFETAKTFIDNMLNDKYGYVNRYNSPALILEFIGGEPLLEIKLTRKIYEYFLEQCYELNHPWFNLHRVSICSNGLSYFDPEVQDFFKEYAQNISFNISIDGNKELHDACRVQPNGEGSYDIDIAALNHYNKYHTPERNSKMTLAPSNIKYLYDSVVNFIKNGMTCININCVFEEGWTQETALIEYQQLKKLADYLLENNLEHLYIAIFNERQEDMMSKYNDSAPCGGQGSMLSLRLNGQFYPCIRYMPSSVGSDVKDLCIGNIESGIIGREQDSEVLQMMDRITRRSAANDICFECPISNDCAYCLAHGHSIFGTPNKRGTFTCLMMFAEHLANVYYWNKLLVKHPEYDLPIRKNVLPDEWSLLVIDQEELNSLKLLECTAIAVKIGLFDN